MTDNDSVGRAAGGEVAAPLGRAGTTLAAFTRRAVLGGVGGTAAALVGGAVRVPGLAAAPPALAQGAEESPVSPSVEAGRVASAPGGGRLTGAERAERAYQIRVRAAERMRAVPLAAVGTARDEEIYPNRIGSFSKGLPHDELGVVNPFAYEALVAAVESGDPVAFEQIPMGGAAKLRNPQAGLAFDLIGPDSHQLSTRRPPAFASAEAAAEMGELYWLALARDVPFGAYDGDPVVAAAAADLSTFSDFRGPKEAGRRVTSGTLFRCGNPGVAVGPFVSQFLLKDCPTGAIIAPQMIRTLLPVDHLATADEWLAVQNGTIPTSARQPVHDPVPRYVRNGRDLAESVHWDWPGQAAHNAALIAYGAGGLPLASVFAGATTVPVDASNPYLRSRTQDGFGTFDLAHVTALVGLVANSALKAAWYQKWFVSRRLRPEEFGGRVHHLLAAAGDPIHDDLLERSAVLDESRRRFGTLLLPQAYPEGCPLHPAFPSGHATWAGAAITVLKAVFDESVPIANPVVAAADGLTLEPYAGPDADRLTLGGELNKLAWNIAVGRVFAGVHWRTDGIEGLRLGEAVALGVLRDLRDTYHEDFDGYRLTTFDGVEITA